MRILITFLSVFCLFGQDDPAADRERVRQSLDKIRGRDIAKKNLLYERRFEKRELGPDGLVKSHSVVITRRDPWEELVVTRVVSRDEKPLSAAENQKQEEKLRKSVEEQRRNPPKSKDDTDSWMDELPDAMEFHKLGIEQINGRSADMYDFGPRPGYKAKQMRTKAVEKITGKVWIDREDGELTKVDLTVFDAINVGFGMLGRVEKGTHFEMERKKWAAGVWFESWQRIRFEVKVMIVKSLRQELENHWSNVSVRPVGRLTSKGN